MKPGINDRLEVCEMVVERYLKPLRSIPSCDIHS